MASLRRLYREAPLPLSLKMKLRTIAARAQTVAKTMGRSTSAPPAATPGSAKRFAALILGETTPDPARDAGSLRIFNLVKELLSIGGNVTFVPERDLGHAGAPTAALEGMGVRCLHFPRIRSVGGLLQREGSAFDVVVLERVAVAHRYLDLVRRRSPKAAVIFDTQDLHYLRVRREAKLLGSLRIDREARALERMERAAMAKADLTFVVSEYERDALLREDPDSKLAVLPLIMEPAPIDIPFADRRGVLFIGGFHHGPNLDAVRHFAAAIWPRVATALPDAVFHIVGGHPPIDIKALAGERIRVWGQVNDLTPLLGSCRLSVAPLRFGAGVKGKIATSLAHGLPCVVSPMGLEGSGLLPDRHVLLADDAAAFAEAIIHLYTDEEMWQRLSRAGVVFVAETYSSAAIRPRLEATLRRLEVLA